MKIPIDFVAGTHGHFLEIFLNRSFNFVSESSAEFGPLGTSHTVTNVYSSSKVFDAHHWYEYYKKDLKKYKKTIVITFEPDDLLMVSSTSLLRASDLNIHNNFLNIDTVKKLNNQFYSVVLDEIFKAYPFLDKNSPDIPRYVLREFFKFGFKDPEQNGYSKQLQLMLKAHLGIDHFKISVQDIYCYEKLTKKIKGLADFLNIPATFNESLKNYHELFLSKLQFSQDKKVCDNIISSVIAKLDMQLPKLTLFQESYVNAILENHYGKEMPFRQDQYFTNTKDMLYYINEKAPNL